MNRSMLITKLLTQEDTPGSFITPIYKSRDHQNQNFTSQKSHHGVKDVAVSRVALYLALTMSLQF